MSTVETLCEWNHEGKQEYGHYETTCKNEFWWGEFDDAANPERDYHFKYCPWCGRTINFT